MTTQSKTRERTREDGVVTRLLPPDPDDLVILARDDAFYLLKKEAYQDPAHEIRTSMVGQAKLLVDQGVLLADIPVTSLPGTGAMCYLVNLSGFRPRKPKLEPQPPVEDCQPVVEPPPLQESAPRDAEQVEPAIDDILICDRAGEKLYWVRKREYQRAESRLDRLDPMLEGQVRLLTRQGVVIADVPGGSLLGVDEMGCLVSLKGIHRPDTKEALSRRPEAAH